MKKQKTLKYTKCFKVHEEELTWELFIKYLNKNMEFCFNFNNMTIDIAFHYEGKKKVYELNISLEDKTTNLVFDSVDELIYFKAFNNNILNELPDEFIRKMRLTGLISIRGMGRFIDINSLEDYKIKYILDNYSNIKKFSTEKEYFDYMKIIDSKLISSERNLTMNNDTKRMLFTKWVSSFDENILCSELKIVADCKKKSKHELFKYIDEPLRLEFLTSLLLQKHFNDIVVKPNYSIDDEGLPTSYAIGGTPDIECLDEEGNILFEVTLLTGTQQCIREMPAIARHL